MTRNQRRLAAIVSVDVVGSSRLMGVDEVGTLDALRAHRRELIDPKVAEFAGRIVKNTGDGVLLEFPSVVDAVRCAVEIQRAMPQRNVDIEPDRRIEFRIGINVGDIIIEDDDIFGDGVNVAARLEALAEPGGICVSGVVRDQVLDKLSFTFEALGPQTVKNIARPVEVYRVALESRPMSTARRPAFPRPRPGNVRWWIGGGATLAALVVAGWIVQTGRSTTHAPPPPMSVAILPFAAPSATPADEQFADTLTRELTTALGRWRIANVASLGLAAPYRGKPFDPRTIGRELNVLYLVEGDVRFSGDSVAVSTRLVEARTGTQAWNVRRVLSQSELAQGSAELVAWLAGRLRSDIYASELRRAANVRKGEATLHDLVLQAEALGRSDRSDSGRAEARRRLEEVLQRDRDFLPALMSLAELDMNELFADTPIEPERFENLLREADALTTRAVELAPDFAPAWNDRSSLFALRQRWEPALEANAVSLKLDPSSAFAHTWRALLLLWSGEAAASLPLTTRAIALDPSNAGYLLLVQCHSFLMIRRFEEAVATCEKSIGQYDYWLVYVYLAAAYAQRGDADRAAAIRSELARRKADVSIASLRRMFKRLSNHPVFQQQTEDNVMTGLVKAGFAEK